MGYWTDETGWDSRVYIVEGSYVFKFPRKDKVKQGYAKEIAALKFVNTIETTITFPLVVREHPDNEYFGYQIVPGRSLQDSVDTLKPATRQMIGQVLDSFLKQFHRSKLAEANMPKHCRS